MQSTIEFEIEKHTNCKAIYKKKTTSIVYISGSSMMKIIIHETQCPVNLIVTNCSKFFNLISH